ncbi:Uncharacterised protein [uncultured Roseburia sp.]|uniref:Uncharacterized protein n=1 Tax=Brotonthovivens ammoniilytica TaxID=2981725 RepID=A0ABT2TN11_9FIRM|nr:hypothetical protein [Brotonthovivens ammoniilytica]MCU6763623.1 hypothetical protein [Brotonthovivens ammoniilytica]SCJ27300.1 Uncharacterised protein [uncultured Roseburia sp.]
MNKVIKMRDWKKRKNKTKKDKSQEYLDVMTLLVYTVIAMAAAVCILALTALITQTDVTSWNNTILVSVFFILTGIISGVFLLQK